jgi:histidinol-phosphate/aromatic aminotransferase/cobyric acid decarboxylase-like protein
MGSGARTIELTLATLEDREEIYAIRHQVYARDLRQYPDNPAGVLQDQLDEINSYIVAKRAGSIVGFVAVTPPTAHGYSIDKYFRREDLPLTFDAGLYEVRLLTVTQAFRHGWLAVVLMYAALRLVESQGAHTIVAIGRVELLNLYARVGLQSLGKRARSGAVTYELLAADIPDLGRHLASFQAVVERLERLVSWRLASVPFRPRPACYHGGAFFSAIGETFDTLQRKDTVINADVLDAWFDPAPSVLIKLSDHLAFSVKTSPPTHGEGLQRTIAATRGIGERSILPGAGSSDLIFAGLQRWVAPNSRVLILDPMYGEYAHVLGDVIGAKIDRFRLSRTLCYDIDGTSLAAQLANDYDWVVLVNPNSPTGRYMPRRMVERILADAPATTRFWIDETYVDYVGSDHSLEAYAAASSNVIVCKSMSKAYALSGVRVAYLCGPPALIDDLRPHRPPWSVSLPGQMAACEALKATDYYRAAWRTTHELRAELQKHLEELGWDVIPGCANFLLCGLPTDGPDAAELATRTRRFGLFVREVANMGPSLGRHALRIAVKDRDTNHRMLEILQAALRESVPGS